MRQILKEKFIPNSSLVEYMIYDHETFKLDVKYKSGKKKGQTRRYHNITFDDFNSIISSDSAGHALISLVSTKREEGLLNVTDKTPSVLQRLFTFLFV
ncbi:KTSC domain-containing protein [Flammeovirgaceae bacterium SG7u.111]|nr:KTSC domain-containing protein [Flammeovirgaceae bacterium SG7u.132]WPO33670.1 KTSC domain-containing protein [Flammeovirgaceae bacterium SG7u.111]